MKFVAMIDPIGKPRMTKRDKWARRPAVLRYRRFADDLRAAAGSQVETDIGGLWFAAYLSMPKSWSRKKKEAMQGKPHRQKPDVDNIAKAILDSLLEEDSGVWNVTGMKMWDDGNGARLEVGLT